MSKNKVINFFVLKFVVSLLFVGQVNAESYVDLLKCNSNEGTELVKIQLIVSGEGGFVVSLPNGNKRSVVLEAVGESFDSRYFEIETNRTWLVLLGANVGMPDSDRIKAEFTNEAGRAVQVVCFRPEADAN